jgi:diguanylate cyclase (GGDEF)-like protein/PAS domain S-box-containing protein
MRIKPNNKIIILIGAGNLLILIMMVMIGFLVLNGMRELSSITSELYEHPFTVSKAALVVKFKIEHIRDHMLEIALTRDANKAREVSSELAELEASVRENFAIVEHNFLGDPEKLREVHRLLDEWRDARTRTVDLASQGRWDKVEKLVVTANRAIFVKLNDDVDYIVGFANNKAQSFTSQARDENLTKRRQIMWLLAGFAVLIVCIGAEVARRTWRIIRAGEKAVEATAKAEKSYRSLFENMLEGYAYGRVVSENGRPRDFTFLDVNDSFKRIIGQAELVGKNASEAVPGICESDPGLMEMVGEVAATSKPIHVETFVKALKKWLSISVYSTEAEYFVSICDDITPRKDYEREMRLSDSIFKASSEAMLIIDAQNNVISVNPAFTQITGYAADEVLGKNPIWMISDPHEGNLLRKMRHALQATNHWEGEIWEKKKSGEPFVVRLTVNSIPGDGAPQRLAVQFSDITEKKRADEALSRHANFDTLTGLANRRMFLTHLELEIKKARRSHHKLALLFLDLDRFKEVNDRLGHQVGDKLLVEASRRIVSCVRESDIAARLGGDEFTLILSEITDVNRIENVAHAIVQSVSKPYQLGGEEITCISASVGITVYPTDALEALDLVKNADQAMYLSKAEGRNRYHFYTPAMQEASLKHNQLAQDLRVALSENQLLLHFQPIVDLRSGEIFKAETLLRWQHPVHGMIDAAGFIPIAEEIGMMEEIGDWVFGASLAQAKLWAGLTGKPFRIGVNISSAQLMTKGKDSIWINRVHEAKLSGQNVSIEINEKTLLNDRPEVADSLVSIRDAGMELTIDNFGTGYSSLSCLQKFKIDYLKIDRTLTMCLKPGSTDLTLSEAIIAMAHKLGMKAIAEGIESAEQRDLLRAAGCDFGQGYFFSRPVPREEFEGLLRRKFDFAAQ